MKGSATERDSGCRVSTKNCLRVLVDAPQAFVNHLVPVRLVAVAEDGVVGEWLGGPVFEGFESQADVYTHTLGSW